jgi:predicted DNA-binding transcriptional regulator AlpA
MPKSTPIEIANDQLLSPTQVAELVGISSRTVLNLPIKRVRVGSRLIRFRWSDVCRYLGIAASRPESTESR